MGLNTKIKTLKIVLRDNGLIEGIRFMIPFLSQLYLRFPSKHIYSYNVKPLNRIIKFIHQTNIVDSATLIDVFGYRTYLKSNNGSLTFKLNENSKVLDLGAFVGDTAVFFAIQGAKVYSYEPQKEACKMAIENLRLNNLEKNVNIFNMAVTADGRNLLFDDSRNNVSGMFSVLNNKKGREIKSMNFSKILAQEKKWDLIKIDIEGGEYELLSYLKGNKKLFRKISSFIIEFDEVEKHENEIREFIKTLKNLGFITDYSQRLLYAKR